MRFEKGYIYIVQVDNKHWYLVRQVGMKSWVSFNIAHLGIEQNRVTKRDNGVDLWASMKPTAYKKFVDVPSEQKLFRQYMFDVLRYGYFKD